VFFRVKLFLLHIDQNAQLGNDLLARFLVDRDDRLLLFDPLILESDGDDLAVEIDDLGVSRYRARIGVRIRIRVRIR
jgi:hypothetical protein